VEPPYKPGDGRPRWNDTYNKHPVWNGPPTNPNTHNYRPLEKGKHIVCFNCGELGHYRNECPNPRKQVGYTPLCGRCHEPGHISTYCTTVITEFPPSERDYPKTKQVQITENINHIAQMLDSEPVYVTRSQARKALVERSSHSDSPTVVIKKTKDTPKKLIPDILVMDKLLNPIPVILPNITLNPIPSTSELPQRSQESIEKSTTEVPIVEINSKPPIPLISKPPLITPTFYRTPRKVQKETISPVKKQKHNRIMKLAVGMDPYDILTNMDNIQPQITLRQILAIAPRCRSELSSSLVRKRDKMVNVNDISLDPGASIVDVIIDGSLIHGVQVDTGSSVNLRNVDTMEELGLTSMTTTPIILRMVDQSRVKPLGMLSQLLTIIGGIDYKIDYVVFKVSESISTYPILLGRPWLYSAKAKDDWRKGTLTIGKGVNKIVLPMYPTKYHGETQDEDTNVTTSNTYGSESESTKIVNNEQPMFKCIGLRKYIQPIEEEYSNAAILKWENSLVFIITRI
jgi:hypothetical protein